jgi:hypothetical protein
VWLFLACAVAAVALLRMLHRIEPRCMKCGCKDWDAEFASKWEDLVCACCGWMLVTQMEIERQQLKHAEERAALKRLKRREAR